MSIFNYQLYLETGGKRECQSVGGGNLATDASDADDAFALFAVADLYACGLVGVAERDVVVVADAVFVAPLVAY